MRILTVPTLALAALTMSVTFGAPGAGVSAQNVGEKFTAFAINMNSGPKTATVDIKIDRWSTDAEREQLLSILLEEKDQYPGESGAAQGHPEAAEGRLPSHAGDSRWDLHYARQNPMEDGGRQIVVATDRPVGFREARNQPRTMDYPFTVIEMRLNKEDKGEGKMLAGTKIYIDPKTKNLVLENYAQQPVRLNEIRKIN